jgi:hypothetical protein
MNVDSNCNPITSTTTTSTPTSTTNPSMGTCAQYTCDVDGFLIFINSVSSTETNCGSSYCYGNCYADESCRGQTAYLYSPP